MARPIFKSSQTNLKKKKKKTANKQNKARKTKQNKTKTKTRKKKPGVRQTHSILYHRPKKGFFLRVRTWPTCMCPLALQELARPTCALALPKLHGAIPGAQQGYTLYLWAKRINLHQSSGLGLDQCLLMLKRPRPILGILI